jgi:hypothetical protein
VKKQSFQLCCGKISTKIYCLGAFTPSYSTHLKLPNHHSKIKLNVTNNKKIIILIMKPLAHITKGVIDIIISSRSKIKKIIQKIKKRRETGNTLTLNESKPHSKVSLLINFDLTIILPNPIIKGINKAINK